MRFWQNIFLPIFLQVMLVSVADAAGKKDSGEKSRKSEKLEKSERPEKIDKPAVPKIEKQAPPVPIDYGPDPDKKAKRASTEELLEGPEAGLVTTNSSVLIGIQVVHNPGMNVQFPGLLRGAPHIGFGLDPFSIYADMMYFFTTDFKFASMPDVASFHSLRGKFLLSAGGGLETGRSIGVRGIIGGQYSMPKLPMQFYTNVMGIYFVANEEFAGGLTWGISIGARIML